MSRQQEKDLLLELRSSIAKRSGQSTYLVYNDEELETLLGARPKSIEELAKIKGFPKDGKRVEAYGRDLVSIFTGKGAMTIQLRKMEDMKASNIFGGM